MREACLVVRTHLGHSRAAPKSKELVSNSGSSPLGTRGGGKQLGESRPLLGARRELHGFTCAAASFTPFPDFPRRFILVILGSLCPQTWLANTGLPRFPDPQGFPNPNPQGPLPIPSLWAQTAPEAKNPARGLLHLGQRRYR